MTPHPDRPSRPTRWWLFLAATLSLAAPGLLAPAWGPLLAAAAPIPICLAFLLRGRRSGWTVTLAASAAMGLAAGLQAPFLPAASASSAHAPVIAGTLVALYFFLETGVLGLVLGAGLQRRLSYLQLTVLGAGILVGGYLAIALINGGGSFSRAGDLIVVEMEKSVDMMEQALIAAGGSGTSPIDRETFRQVGAMAFPGLFAIGAMMNSLFCALLASRLVAPLVPSPLLHEWRLPEPLVWAFIAVGFAAAWNYRGLLAIPLGILMVLAFLYLIQGVAVALARQRNIAAWIRFMMALVVLLQPLFLSLFLVLGLLDFRFDFRRPRTPPPSPGADQTKRG